MNPVLADLLQLLELERIEENIFRGQSRDIGSDQIFGGQVVGQALSAAYETVDDRRAHSLHAYFLRRGDVNSPIVYEVDRQRDGRSFSVRRVVAIQHGRPIFNMAASFQKTEAGMEHQAAMPDVPGPGDSFNVEELDPQSLKAIPQKMRRFITRKRPFEVRPVRAPNFESGEKLPPVKHVWFRAVDKLADNDKLHQSLLAYASDYELLGTATLPHGLSFGRANVQMASIDHALWFHRQVRVDQWLLYTMDSPSMAHARGYSRGFIFDESGVLLASATQEGLVRIWDEELGKNRRAPGKQV